MRTIDVLEVLRSNINDICLKVEGEDADGNFLHQPIREKNAKLGEALVGGLEFESWTDYLAVEMSVISDSGVLPIIMIGDLEVRLTSAKTYHMICMELLDAIEEELNKLVLLHERLEAFGLDADKYFRYGFDRGDIDWIDIDYPSDVIGIINENSKCSQKFVEDLENLGFKVEIDIFHGTPMHCIDISEYLPKTPCLWCGKGEDWYTYHGRMKDRSLLDILDKLQYVMRSAKQGNL